MRLAPIFAAVVLSAVHAGAQGTVVKDGPSYSPVPNPTFETAKDLTYKVAWNISQGAAKPNEVNPLFEAVARFVNSLSTAGVPRANVQLAMVVHGTAAVELLSNAAYKARMGFDNPNATMLEELAAAGVRIIICGQTIASRKLPREQLLSAVQVSLSATWAFAVLQAQGYRTNPF